MKACLRLIAPALLGTVLALGPSMPAAAHPEDAYGSYTVGSFFLEANAQLSSPADDSTNAANTDITYSSATGRWVKLTNTSTSTLQTTYSYHLELTHSATPTPKASKSGAGISWTAAPEAFLTIPANLSATFRADGGLHAATANADVSIGTAGAAAGHGHWWTQN